MTKPLLFLLAAISLVLSQTPATDAQLKELFATLDGGVSGIRECKKELQAGRAVKAKARLLEYYRTRRNFKWLFSRKYREDLASDFRKDFPKEASAVVGRADSLLKGRWFWHDAYRDCGFPPRWQEEMEDAEQLAALNRHEWFSDLGQAYWLTEDEKYASAFAAILDDWLARSEAPPLEVYKSDSLWFKIFPWQLLNTAVRPKHWISAFEYFLDSPAVTPDLWARSLLALLYHRLILREISPLVWPDADHNWYLMEMEGLYTIALGFPEFNTSAGDLAFARDQLERCMRVQVLADGVHAEQTPGYHEGCIWWFAGPYLLARENSQKAFSSAYKDGLRKMFYFLSQITRTSGGLAPFGDSDADDPAFTMGLGEYLFQAPVSGRPGRPGERLYWMSNGTRLRPGKAESDMPLLAVFPQGGYACVRSSWKEDALFLALRNGNGMERSGHQHADHLGIDVTAYGDPLIVDPGIYSYVDDAWREYFKSTRAHNTLCLDSQSTMKYRGAWRWEGFPERLELSGISADRGRTIISGKHNGYAPAECRRSVTFMGKRFWLVRDFIRDAENRRVSVSYNFATERAAILPGPYTGAKSIISTDQASVVIVQLSGGAEALLEEGWHSTAYGEKKPNKVLRLNIPRAPQECEVVCALIPFARGETQSYSLASDAGGREFTLVINGESPYRAEIKLDEGAK